MDRGHAKHGPDWLDVDHATLFGGQPSGVAELLERDGDLRRHSMPPDFPMTRGVAQGTLLFVARQSTPQIGGHGTDRIDRFTPVVGTLRVRTQRTHEAARRAGSRVASVDRRRARLGTRRPFTVSGWKQAVARNEVRRAAESRSRAGSGRHRLPSGRSR